MDMAAILFDGAELFEQIAIPFWQKAPCEIWCNLLKRFKSNRNLKITQFYRCILPRGKGTYPPEDTILIITKVFFTLITRCKFHPWVFNTFWENEF